MPKGINNHSERRLYAARPTCLQHRLLATLATCALATAAVLSPYTLAANSNRTLSSFELNSAYADPDTTEVAPSDLQTRIEDSAARYEEACQRIEELDAQIAENTLKIEEFNAQLPQLRADSAEAMKALYRIQVDSPSIIALLLSTTSLDDFLTTVMYVNRIHDDSMEEIVALNTLIDELNTTQETLNANKTEAVNAKQEAETALEEAQAARQEAQRIALEESIAQAEAQAELREEAEKNNQNPGEQLGPSTQDGANWDSGYESFINTWTPRIDAYLAGSPMAGTGRLFADAAWRYGVDPRWSPAIATIESSRGLYCFAPYNAWGWGSSGFSSWEEAIDVHVRGLARGYGYTLTPEAAQKYCPPTWQDWYNKCAAQMALI